MKKLAKKKKKFVCDCCGGTFETGRTEEEVEKEYQDLFPEDYKNKEDRAIVCDVCFKKIIRKEKRCN